MNVQDGQAFKGWKDSPRSTLCIEPRPQNITRTGRTKQHVVSFVSFAMLNRDAPFLPEMNDPRGDFSSPSCRWKRFLKTPAWLRIVFLYREYEEPQLVGWGGNVIWGEKFFEREALLRREEYLFTPFRFLQKGPWRLWGVGGSLFISLDDGFNVFFFWPWNHNLPFFEDLFFCNPNYESTLPF